MDLATKTPVEIDTELSKLWQAQERALHYLTMWQRDLQRHMDGKARYGYNFEEQAEAGIAKYQAELADLKAQARPFEAEYAARRWNRYFLVTNSNGHVHRGMDCNTCFPTTQYAWLIDLADCDEDKMIEEYGEMACTVCFPTAPANPRFHGPGRLAQEALAAKAAEKAAKEEAKAQKEAAKAERAAKAAAKALEPKKLSAKDKRFEAVAKISNAIHEGMIEEASAQIEAAFALGKTDRWQAALKNLARLIHEWEDKGEEPGGMIQAMIHLGWQAE